MEFRTPKLECPRLSIKFYSKYFFIDDFKTKIDIIFGTLFIYKRIEMLFYNSSQIIY